MSAALTSPGPCLVWRPTAKQEAFLNAREDEVLYGGAVGGGKSEALLMFSILRRTMIPRSRGLILRRTYPELEMTHIRRSKELLLHGGGVRYSEQHKRWLFPNGSILQFGYAERYDDLLRYQSAEFEDVCIDEASQFTEQEYLFLMSRLRTTKRGVRCLMRLASNPGGIGHAWLKRRFVDVARDATYRDPETGLTRRYIPATLDDNPHIDKAAYERRLAAMPDDLRRMYRYGEWDVFAGQVFAEFARTVHVVDPFPLPGWWRRWLANDPGYAEHFAWYWFAADDEGNVYVYREYTNEPGERVPYSQQAARVVELTGGEQLEFCVVGLDAFNRHPETGKAIVDYYREGGLQLPFLRAVHGPDSRKLRAATLHEYLKVEKAGDGAPRARLRVFATCRKLIETLPMLTADPRDPEAVAKTGLDHWYDALTYGLCAWHAEQSVEPPPEPQPLPWPLRTEEPEHGRRSWLKW